MRAEKSGLSSARFMSDLLAGLRRLPDLDAAWAERLPGRRLRALVRGAEAMRERLASGPRALAVRTLPLTTLLYPTNFAFNGAARSPAPFVLLTHRALLVQFLQDGEPKTLLFNPTDVSAAQRTPYFARLVEQFGETLSLHVLTERFAPLEAQLGALGLTPTDVDYVAFDHFHTQDLRTLLGTTDRGYLSRFPNATLLAPKTEWDSWDELHPLQRAWFVADGRKNVNEGRVALTTSDLELGDGVWLIRTPGHTVGNQTLFVNTESGVWGCSENGTSADCYSPFDSGLAGLAAAARQRDLDVILNANTPEGGGDQLASMLIERILVDRVKRAPSFVQMLPSSEVTPSLVAPGIRPTMIHRSIESGLVAIGAKRPRSTSAAFSQATVSAS